MIRYRLFFVGIHNKPGMVPLDSGTVTGRRIDFLMTDIPRRFNCIKTNLFDKEYLPEGFCEKTALQEWMNRNLITNEDRVVVLGEMVGNCFRKFFPEIDHVVFIKHPSAYALKPKDIPAWKENALNEINKL